MTEAPLVLLVEDNEDDALLARRALRRYDPSLVVDVAGDGDAALAYLLGGGRERPPDLVLLDLQLPGSGGLEVLRTLRAAPRGRRLLVVVLTSSLQPGDLTAAYDLGASSYVRKPVDFARFCGIMASVCRYWLELNEAPPAQ